MMEMFEIEQHFPDDRIEDIEGTVRRLILNHPSLSSLSPKGEIAVAVGSRGIANIVEIVRSAVSALRAMGFAPFLVPAMGSHGGGTAEGQIAVLHHLGITEQSVGAPIRSSMEVVHWGHTSRGVPVYFDKNAASADGLIAINRIKPHTAFRGSIESGIGKMLAVGLGKMKGASAIHSRGPLSMAQNIEDVANIVLGRIPVFVGLAIVENGYDETESIVTVSKENWLEQEAELLKKARTLMPALPVSQIDVLIIEEMGKCYSGTGMDPNVIGRWRIEGVEEPKTPKIKRIVVLDLAEKSYGNAQGIGLADFTTQVLVDKMDRHATYTNALTSTYIMRAMLPFIFPTEREAVETAVASLGTDVNAEELKVVQIPNTLHLHRLLISRSVMRELELSGKITVIGRKTLSFDRQGKLVNKLT